MEADWEFQIAEDAPVIDALWSGFIDLRSHSARVSEIPEARKFPALAAALLALNEPNSPVWTSKCDTWRLDSIDPDEFEASSSSASAGLACYIDLLSAQPAAWGTLDEVAEWCRTVCGHIHSVTATHCRVDLVIRRAVLNPETIGLGITAYVAGCGASAEEASTALAKALCGFSQQVLKADAVHPASKYNRDKTGE